MAFAEFLGDYFALALRARLRAGAAMLGKKLLRIFVIDKSRMDEKEYPDLRRDLRA
jgi:hypothetical protein